MPRYIDADKLKQYLIDNDCFFPSIAKQILENAPTEDVEPKIEVDKALQLGIDIGEQEAAERIFEEIEQEAYKNEEGDLYLDLPDYLKIKKKYIGE